MLCPKVSRTGKGSIFITNFDFPANAVENLSDFKVDHWKESVIIPRNVLLKKIHGKHAVIITIDVKVDEEFLKAAGPKLKVVSTLSAGYDHIDIQAMKKYGVKLGNVTEIHNDAVAEFAIALLLAQARRLYEGREAVLNNAWPAYSPLFWLNGVCLKGKVVGIIGLGKIGIEVGRRLVGFKVQEILYTSRSEKEEAYEFGGKKVELEHLLRESDFVIITCILCDDTKHLLSDKEFKKMKPSSILVNVARGGIVDQDALVRALKRGTIQGAALDVMTPEPIPNNHELVSMKNCCKYSSYYC